MKFGNSKTIFKSLKSDIRTKHISQPYSNQAYFSRNEVRILRSNGSKLRSTYTKIHMNEISLWRVLKTDIRTLILLSALYLR